MNPEQIVPIRSLPGVKRDGTEFEGNNYVDAQWCRFRRGLPRKMGGYRSITQNLQGPIYSVFVHSSNNVNRIYTGSSSALEYTDVTPDGIGGGVGAVTPATLAANNYNLWQMDELYDSGGSKAVLLAHAAPNLYAIDSTEQQKIWYGDIVGSAALVDTTCPAVSGGVYCAAPYAFALDNDGLFRWCAPNSPTNWATGGAGSQRITQSKLVYGAQIRGPSGGNPSSLVWSLDRLIVVTFIGGTPIWDYNTVGQTSLMSSRSVVQYNGVFYWLAQNKFQMFNGVLNDVENKFNLDYLLDNVNMNQRQKVWSYADEKYGELHWMVPTGDGTDPVLDIIYNVRENEWYDNIIRRTHGYASSVFRWPVLADVEQSTVTTVRVLNGTAGSSAGTAGNAYDGNTATVCSAGVNGNITYDFGQYVTKSISRISLQPGAAMTSPTAVLIEYSLDTGTAISNWTTLKSIPSQAWVTGTIYDFDISPAFTVRGIRVSVSGGATLELEELYIYSNGYMVHQHEFGVDRIVDSKTLAIPSWFETADISWVANGPVAADSWVGKDVWMEVIRLEPDFVQTGDITVSINGRAYPKSELVSVDMQTFSDDTEKVDFKSQFRILRFKFESNTQGGNYQMGEPLLKVGEGDARQ